ncbi:MAG: enolase C-terminal domain-like protein [Pirellulaceae bacterium]|nr:enolase C-terminal domain-like protein [Pirellulaceae bacterium]
MTLIDPLNPNGISRRQTLQGLAAAAAGVSAALASQREAASQIDGKINRGSAPIRIRKVRAIATAPQSIRLVVVKVETTEPGLYGLGCATFNQRPLAVVEAVNKYLDPFAKNRAVDNIEDLWQTAYTSSYWRNGPVLNNALSGLDMALWDIKGKRAGMPIYQLLGGKSRFAVDCYAHASGDNEKELEESVRRLAAKGFRHIRIQLGAYGSPHLSKNPDFRTAGFGQPQDTHMDSAAYLQAMPKIFEHMRKQFGNEIELLHDVHERIQPIEAIGLLKQLEPYKPFFIEDPLAPEQNGYFPQLRQQTACPIAMGELFNNPHEWVGLITDRLIDFIRVHISQIGGLTPARKLATLAECFGVRTAWHGPGDVSPVGHACNGHLDLTVHNFGIQEAPSFTDAMKEVFPGSPEVKNGYMHVNEAPGFGVDINETLAAKYPLPQDPGYWEPVRRRDGTAVRP